MASLAPQIGDVNKLDFEPVARVMIRDRDTEPGACGRDGPRNEILPAKFLNPFNQAILRTEVAKRGAGEPPVI